MPVEISASEEMEPAGIVMSMVGGLLVVEVRLARSCLMAGAGGSRGCDHLHPVCCDRPSQADPNSQALSEGSLLCTEGRRVLGQARA